MRSPPLCGNRVKSYLAWVRLQKKRRFTILTYHRISKEKFHYKWNNEHDPALEVEPGDSVTFEVNDVLSWQLSPDSKIEDLSRLDWSKSYPLSGPVYVLGASPGDALSVEVEKIETADWGWTAISPPLGLLPEFKENFLWIWKGLKAKDGYANFKNGLRVPLAPFCGVMGVAPKEKGAIEVMPPGRHGGNMDIKHLNEGSKHILPVWVPGALFSVGDMHAAQGDGEVCVSAIECPGEVTLKFDLLKNAGIESPRYFTGLKKEDVGYFVTTGISPDLMEASRQATREMISYLIHEHGLSREEAYVLCSVAADLKIHEVVDAPNWVVGLAMPRSVFGE
jgi:acetamidase/formamidase